MKRIVLDRWIDLGELGSRRSMVVGQIGAYGSFDLLDSVTADGVELLPLVDAGTRDMLVDELRAKYQEQVEAMNESMREAA